MHAAIRNGDDITGVTTMKMVERMDAGPIYDQMEVTIDDDDNVGTLETKLSIAGRALLLKTLKDIEAGTASLNEQNKKEISFAYHIRPNDRRIDFKQTAEDIKNHIRAFNPWPVARFTVDDKTCKVFESSVIHEDKPYGQPGEVVVADKKRLHIQTGQGQISIRSIQYPGKKRMAIGDFMNGVGRTLFYEGKIVK
jgi:methionyl-tRNA formyltransferase